MATNQQMAKEFRDMARSYLNELAGNPTTPNDFARYAQWGGPNVMDPLNGSGFYRPTGGVNVARGTAPSESDVDKLIEMMGGNPYAGRKASRRNAGGGGSTGNVARAIRPGVPQTQEESEQSILEQLAAEFQSKINEANAANLARYDEGKGELSDLRGRNQSRVENWGRAAQEDIDERMREALGDASANLAARGLGNSNILDAFRLRAARDTAREQQRVSEMRDSRASQYDTNDTNNLVGFIERRNDIAPDYGQLIGLADRIGQADALKAFQENMAAERAQRQQQPQYGGYGGYGGFGPFGPMIPSYGPQGPHMRAPAFVNLFGGAMNSLPSGPAPVVSNAYPTVNPRPSQAPRQPVQGSSNPFENWSMLGALGAGAGPAGAIAAGVATGVGKQVLPRLPSREPVKPLPAGTIGRMKEGAFLQTDPDWGTPGELDMDRIDPSRQHRPNPYYPYY